MLKPLAEIGVPDSRFQTLVVEDQNTGMRPMTVADHFAEIAAINLLPTVSNRVRTIFERGRNAFLYAWYVYDLTALAEAQGYAALEVALKERLAELPNRYPARGLGEQMQRASQEGLFDTFPLPPGNESTDRDGYFTQLTNLIRRFRNEFAHGTDYVNMPGAALDALYTCAALINHLYRR